MTRGFQASAASTAPVNGQDVSLDGESVVSTVSVMEHSPIESLQTPNDESPLRSPSESSRSSASRTPSSRFSHSPASSSRSNAASPPRGPYGPSTVARYSEWSNGHSDSNSRALAQAAPTTLNHTTSKKRPLQGESKASAKRQRTQRMTERFFQHSSGLLHRATLENETRAAELEDELRRQQQKREKYESKLRSLRRELEALDPEAAKAFDRGELSSAGSNSAVHVPVGEPSQPVDAATESLLPPTIVQRETALRTSIQERKALFSSFQSLLNPSSSTSSA